MKFVYKIFLHLLICSLYLSFLLLALTTFVIIFNFISKGSEEFYKQLMLLLPHILILCSLIIFKYTYFKKHKNIKYFYIVDLIFIVLIVVMFSCRILL